MERTEHYNLNLPEGEDRYNVNDFNQNSIALDDLIYDIEEDIVEMKETFQDGVDSIYDACVAKGSTPASHSLSDVVEGIMDIETGGTYITKNIIENGIYRASDDHADGYSVVNVDVVEPISVFGTVLAQEVNQDPDVWENLQSLYYTHQHDLVAVHLLVTDTPSGKISFVYETNCSLYPEGSTGSATVSVKIDNVPIQITQTSQPECRYYDPSGAERYNYYIRFSILCDIPSNLSIGYHILTVSAVSTNHVSIYNYESALPLTRVMCNVFGRGISDGLYMSSFLSNGSFRNYLCTGFDLDHNLMRIDMNDEENPYDSTDYIYILNHNYSNHFTDGASFYLTRTDYVEGEEEGEGEFLPTYDSFAYSNGKIIYTHVYRALDFDSSEGHYFVMPVSRKFFQDLDIYRIRYRYLSEEPLANPSISSYGYGREDAQFGLIYGTASSGISRFNNSIGFYTDNNEWRSNYDRGIYINNPPNDGISFFTIEMNIPANEESFTLEIDLIDGTVFDPLNNTNYPSYPTAS